MSTVNQTAPSELPIEQGARTVPDRATFERARPARRRPRPARRPGEEAAHPRRRHAAPQLYFVNTNTFEYHWDFATQGLGLRISNRDFNAITYFRDDRSNLAGTIIANDRFEPAGDGGEAGLYALEFWPTDPVRARHVGLAYDLVRAAMPFAGDRLAYHPAGDTQEALLRGRRAAAARARRALDLARPSCSRTSPTSR